MKDIIYNIFLSSIHKPVVIPLFITGYIIGNRDKWGSAINILLFNVIFNFFLKNIWKIPLPEHLDVGYAFPSGHMQTSVAFYGWLMIRPKNIIMSLICFIIILGEAAALIHFKYHTIEDIIGAIIFASLSIVLYRYLLNTIFQQYPERAGILLGTIGLCFIFFIPPKVSAWVPVGALYGFSIGRVIAKPFLNYKSFKSKAYSLIICGSGIALIMVTTLKFDHNSVPFIFIKYFLMSLWIALAPYVATKILKLSSGMNYY